MIRTRFAPSPTGMLHIGAVRTALFSWLTAKKDGGQFFLRLEDTDQDRYVPGAAKQIIESFNWLGIELDGGPDRDQLRKMKTNEDFEGALENGEYRGVAGPFVQSQRLDIYKRYAEQLVEQGFAYRANETPDELENMRNAAQEQKKTFLFKKEMRVRENVDVNQPHVIRFDMPTKGQTVLDDLILGRVVFENVNVADAVLLKSDGFPTYHLAAMVDDHLQGVTHVIRSQEWLASSPLHVNIIKSLGWELPAFAHVPPVNGEDGKKLSKRHGSQSVFEFRDAGYLQEALINFLAMLGWAPGGGDEQNIFTVPELIQKFSLNQVGASPAVFSYAKLNWMNEQHIKKLSADDLANRLIPFLAQDNLKIDTPAKRETLIQLIPHLQTRLKTLKDASPLVDFVFSDIETPSRDLLIGPKMEQHLSLHALRETKKLLESLPNFDEVTLETSMRKLCDDLALKPNQLFTIVRNAVSGKTITPPLFGVLNVIGRDVTLERLSRAEKQLSG